MNYKKAIKLLSPYHTAKLFCFDPDSDRLNPTCQMSTGLESNPTISINNGLVVADDMFDILYEHSLIVAPYNNASYLPSLQVA